MKNRRGIAGDADPFATLVNPGIDKTLAPHIGLSVLDALGAKYSGRDCGVAKHVYAHRFRCDLLFLRVVAGGLHDSEKLGFALDGAVVVDQQ